MTARGSAPVHPGARPVPPGEGHPSPERCSFRRSVPPGCSPRRGGSRPRRPRAGRQGSGR
ncbi:hypothetical protein AC792_09970 [Arthrobacter sp. RIT-PI-e]|nr:hypothetical protein AC792_09970 [Arthrobacter sp. RIT-PI-e]